MRKVIRLGTASTPNGRRYSIYCEVKLNAGRLQIRGVEGPTKGGNCVGANGQIFAQLIQRRIRPAPGWDHAMVSQFLDAWATYGVAWVRVPEPVAEFLRSLPETDRTPAWV